MHIKDALGKGCKTDFAGFELDASKIELHSAHKREIHLPYSGPLPDALQDNDGAVISIGISVHLTVGVSLLVTKGKDKTRCLIAATPQEINDILFPFFFEDMGHNKCHTKFGNGLDNYWLGSCQSSYTHWRRFVIEGHGIDSVIDQLSAKTMEWVEKYIEDKKTA